MSRLDVSGDVEKEEKEGDGECEWDCECNWECECELEWEEVVVEGGG